MPPPTGVVKGPLMPTIYSRKAVNVSSGNHVFSPYTVFDFSPANTSNHSIDFVPPYAFATAASNTFTEAAQISGPVPSPSIKGIIGLLGTIKLPSAPTVIF